jgi:hypothetical protein
LWPKVSGAKRPTTMSDAPLSPTEAALVKALVAALARQLVSPPADNEEAPTNAQRPLS